MASRPVTSFYVRNALRINKKKKTLILLKSIEQYLSRKLLSPGMYKQSLT